jgi:hypothetical protein
MRHRICTFVLNPSLLLLATAGLACSESPDDGEEFGAVVDDAGTGRALVKTAWGTESLAFRVVDGHAIHQGDIDLGPVDELLQAGARAAVTVDMSERWPNGEVNVLFDASVGESDRNIVRAALQDMESRTPLRFFEIFSPGGDYVRILDAPADADYGGQSNSIGMKGGEQTIKLRSYNQPTVQHEMLHAVGLWHEQSRPDRDDFIQLNVGCIEPSALDQYEKQTGAGVLGPYDFYSLMHYGSSAYCIDLGSGCICPTMEKLHDGTTDFPGSTMTANDVNNVWRMYGDLVAVNSLQDRYGEALATGDFDGDGFQDVAVGIPFEEQGGVTNAGAVLLYKGTSERLVAWRVLDEASMSGGVRETNDRFGEALAAGDFNGDGIDDLAVGAPFEDASASVVDSGAVHIFRGTSTGLVPHATYTQANRGADTEQTGDRFGFSLAAAPIAGTATRDELVVGAPGDTAYSIPLFVASGAVYVFRVNFGAESAYKPTRLVKSGTRAATDDFGFAVAARDIDLDGRAEVVVGATELTDGPGGVTVFRGVTPTGTPANWSAMALYVAELRGPSGAVNDRFGASLAIGGFNSIGPREIAIGAPGRASSSGRVYVYQSTASLAQGGGFSLFQTLAQESGSLSTVSEANDEFGFALAAGNFMKLGEDDLVVGVPGENDQTGQIIVFHGSGAGLVAHDNIRQNNWIGGYEEADDDRFGQALAVGNIDGRGDAGHVESPLTHADIIVGAPLEAPELTLGSSPEGAAESGAIYTLLGFHDLVLPTFWYHQAKAFSE